MCTLIVLYKLLDRYPILAMHNRYARAGSRERPPRILGRGKYRVCCPVDLESRGTWIGFNERGLFLAITDQHTGEGGRPVRSRGKLAVDVLASFGSSSDAAEYVRREAPRGYRKANYIILDPEEGFHVVYDERVYCRRLDAGAHVFTNVTMLRERRGLDEEVLTKAEARRARALELARGLRPGSVSEALEGLKRIASDHAGSPGETSICYHGEGMWFMSSSTIVAVAERFEESRVLYCRGNPCSSRFVDYSHVLSGKAGEVSMKSARLRSVRIALCVTGSVAAIEAPKLARELRRHGADVTCYMTEAGIRYGVSPAVMEWATGKNVVTELTGGAEHLREYDLVVIYPATLNTISKMASGVADDAVTTLCASTPPDRILIAPAMNIKLYDNPFFRRNVDRLAEHGATIVEPRLEEGAAKAPRIDVVLDHVIRALSVSRLWGRRVLILTGPTRYDLDAVRFISNRASGLIGYWLAREAFWRGCDVAVIYGPGTVAFPPHIPVIRAYTTEDVLDRTLEELEKTRYDVAVFSAAILDFKPSKILDLKVRSGTRWSIELVPTPKVIDEVRRRYPDLFIVGFKLEYGVPKEELVELARRRLEQLKPGLIVANDLTEISKDRHRAYIVREDGVREVDGPKSLLAKVILDAVEELL